MKAFPHLTVRRFVDQNGVIQWHIMAGSTRIAVCDSRETAQHLADCANRDKHRPAMGISIKEEIVSALRSDSRMPIAHILQRLRAKRNSMSRIQSSEWLQTLRGMSQARQEGFFNIERYLANVKKDILDLFHVQGPKLNIAEIINGLRSKGITIETKDLRELLEDLKTQGYLSQTGFHYFLRTPSDRP